MDERPVERADDRADAFTEEPEWIPLDQNPHADDKRDVLDPAGEDQNYARLIGVGLAIGVVAVGLVLWLIVF